MSSRIIDYNSFKDKSRDEIAKRFLKYITIEDEKSKQKLRKKYRKTNLKIIVVRNYNLSPLYILEKLEKYYFGKFKDSKAYRNFYDSFHINIQDLNHSNYYLHMENIHSKKHYHFIIFADNDYWYILTLARTDRLDATIKRLFSFFTRLEYVKITPQHLENIVSSKLFEKNIKGFIAKYSNFYDERKITVNVYGGDLNDLDKMRKDFFVEPTAIKFSLKNSPIGVVEGKIFSEGYFALESVQKGYIESAQQTINQLTESYTQINKDYYQNVENYDNYPKRTKDGNGLMINSMFCLGFKIKENRFKTQRNLEEDKYRITLEELDGNIKKYFERNNKRYIIHTQHSFSHFVYDKLMRNKFQITIEPKDNSIIVYTFKNCYERSLRDICNRIITHIETSIESIEPFSFQY